MSKADKMFEELGYEKIEFLGDIYYEKNAIQVIFDFRKKKIIIHGKNILEPELIQAINEKVKELWWNE